jgi:4-amino-4-deoxy-L-arabinose transferase-like glycosyltransferase
MEQRGTSRMSVASRARAFVASPLAWVLAAMFVLDVVGITWGLPSSDAWDNDGVAPRDFLSGLFESFAPGRFYVYPPVHLALLALITLPISVVGVIKAPSLAISDLVRELIHPSYMTAFSCAARATSVVMALGIVYAVAKITEEIHGRRAGVCAAAVCAVNASLTYYAHTSNLDVPYAFWSALALLAFVRGIARSEPRRFRHAAVLMALAVATKDQAYALFLITIPAAIALWLTMDPRARSRTLARECATAAFITVALILFLDGALFNPSGFGARIRFLLGPASQDFVQYASSWRGRAGVLADVVSHFDRYYPLPFALLALAGLVIHVRRTSSERARLVAGLVPLFAIASFTVAFNCVARRTDHRFVLPQSILIAFYAGVALDGLLVAARSKTARFALQLTASVAFAVALFACISVDANLLLDPRYDAEAWLSSHVAAGDTVETYGLNVYMPRIARAVPSARVVRVGPEATDRRNPLPGVLEVRDSYEHAESRAPRWLVVSQAWAWRYLVETTSSEQDAARVFAPTHVANGRDVDATVFFRALVRGGRGFVRVHDSVWVSKTWPRLDIHASTAREIWIFERVPRE